MNKLRITGTLASNAELRVRRHAVEPDHVVLCVRLTGGKGFPIVAALDLGRDRECPVEVAEKARSLRRGMLVTVEAWGLVPQTDHADAVLRLLGVSAVEPAVKPEEVSEATVTESAHG